MEKLSRQNSLITTQNLKASEENNYDLELNNLDGNQIKSFHIDFLKNCQQILDVEIYEKWFCDLEIYSFTLNEIIISTNSKLTRDWVNREFFAKKSFILKLKDFYPKLLKISAIFIGTQHENSIDIPNNNPQKTNYSPLYASNIINLSKNDNIFAYGTELNPKFTFQNFIGAKHNKIALSMAKIIAGCPESPQIFDDKIPFFIHGNVGMGKTHLAQAIAWGIKDNNSKQKVVYLSAEKFMFHFVQSIRNNDIMNFKEKMRSIDVLIVDDVQFIAGKDSTQQEFMNCFNSLVEDNKQVVLVCDRCPTALENIDEKLKSRISGGMIVSFKAPDFEDRLTILKGKAKILNFEISDEILIYIAENLKGSNRDLEGAIKKIYAEKLFGDHEINLNLVKTILSNYFISSSNNSNSIEKIQKIVSDFYSLKPHDLNSKDRSRNLSRARQIAMALSKKHTKESLKNIGDKFNKNHATVIHAIKIVADLENNCPKTSQEIKSIEEILNN